MLCDLGLALSDRGEFQRAERVLADALSAAEARNEPATGAAALMRSTWVQLLSGGALMNESKAKIVESVHALEKLQDESGLAEAYSFLGTLLTWTGRCADAAEVLQRFDCPRPTAGRHQDRYAEHRLALDECHLGTDAGRGRFASL
jgi:hypothetical protein